MQKDLLQFYPTPLALAQKAWSMFRDKDFVRVLEPSAGKGDLLKPFQYTHGGLMGSRYKAAVDVIEVDISHHPHLQTAGARIVGHDFLDFTGVGRYSHIIMNPPFAHGAQHLLHAWEHLFDGEIVCILNAETVRNPFSQERQLLQRLIERHGRVEYHAFAFVDAERSTDVEVALVHLVKHADAADMIGDLVGDLEKEHQSRADRMSWDDNSQTQLMLPKGLVEDAVVRFEAAVMAARDAALYSARASHYAAMLGKTFTQHHQQEGQQASAPASAQGSHASVSRQARKAFAADYDELKDRAWMSILRSTTVLSKLSSRAQKRIESEFDQIKALDFTAKNIYGFLSGLCESAGSIQMDMVLDVFDDIVRYHEENTVFYMGWKSNGRHRTAGMRLKTTRFILPGFATESYNRNLGYSNLRWLDDFDKVFAMLDGKHHEAISGLRAIFEDESSFKRLRDGSRERTDYFDVRYYPKRGTIHFFPRSQALMDRLNRMVGQHRQWIPPHKEQANDDFFAQYEQAERFDSELREQFTAAYQRQYPNRSYRSGEWELRQVVHASMQKSSDPDESSMNAMDEALQAVMDLHGWKPQTAVEHAAAPRLTLGSEADAGAWPLAA